MTGNDIKSAISSGILAWYDLKEGGKALYIENNDADWNGAVLRILSDRGISVNTVAADTVGSFETGETAEFDYIIMIGSLELIRGHHQVAGLIKKALKPDGHFLIAVDNRFGFRYFCGDRDPFTGRSFDGIEGYTGAGSGIREKMDGKCLADSDVRELIDAAGLVSRRYSVLPCIRYPQLFYAEDYLPTEELGMRYIPVYNHNRSVFLREQFIYSDLIKNGLFHQTANGYFYDCSFPGTGVTDVEHVTLAMDRGPVNSGITVIRGRDTVEKRPAFEEGKKKAEDVIRNNEYLKGRGICVIDGVNKDGSLVMPFVHGENGVKYFERLIKEDKDRFIHELESFIELVLNVPDKVPEPDGSEVKDLLPEGMEVKDLRNDDGSSGVWLSRGFPDLVPLNAFHTEKGWIFFDQEFSTEIYPARALILRIIYIAYADPEMDKILPMKYFYDKYGLSERLGAWGKFITGFTDKLRIKSVMDPFWDTVTVQWGLIDSNRRKLNRIHLNEKKLFLDILSGTDRTSDKKVFVFGTGKFAGCFLSQYDEKIKAGELKIEGFLDNKADRDNAVYEDHPVFSPEILKKYDPSELKVIICIGDYDPVLEQLMGYGIENVSVYRPDRYD